MAGNTMSTEDDGLDGLFFPGECACSLTELAPCGHSQQEEGERYVNGCSGGHKHQDPARPTFFIVSHSRETPTQEEFDRAYAER